MDSNRVSDVDWTPEEIERYATFHWLHVDTGAEGPADQFGRRPGSAAHVWRTIGGDCEYLGVLGSSGQFEGAENDLPLIPSLGPWSLGAGPLPAAGGALPYQNGRRYDQELRAMRARNAAEAAEKVSADASG